MTWWKVLGVAAFAGVATGGVLIVRDERRRAAYSPDEVRDRLHARLTAAPTTAIGAATGAAVTSDEPDLRAP